MPPRTSVPQKPQNLRKVLGRLLRYLFRYSWIILLLLLLTLASNTAALLGPSLAGKAISAAEAGAGAVDFGKVGHYSLLMLAAYAGSGVLTLLINLGMMRVSRNIAYDMRRDMFHKLLALPVSYFDRNQAGDIISRVSYDIDVITTSIATDVVQILTSIVTIVGSFMMMLVISPPLMVCALITLPLAYIGARSRARIARPLFSKRSAAYGKMNGFVEEQFSGQKTILAYAHENGVCEDFRQINREAADGYCNAQKVATTIGPLMTLINNFGLSLISMTGGVLYIKQLVDLGSISSFILYSRKFSGPINEIAEISNELLSALAAAERVFRFLDAEEESADSETARELNEVEGHVECEQVDFGYVPGKLILKNFNLDAQAGKTIAIVGPTGAGKTTIINLLMRFYDVDGGEVRVDSHPIPELTRSSLRRGFAMVLQDTWLFSGTIFDNIAYGKENATMEEVVAAAKAAHIHRTIMQLPAGYKTVITEDGSNISKGQKQLMTLARAMLYDSRMLILDEATSNVDTETEKQVQKAIKKLMEGKTCFVIAHRLSTIEHADLILVLNYGEVVEQGTHDELMAKKGFYYKLYAAQFE